MSSGLETTTTKVCGAKIEFFLSDKDGAGELREAYPDFSQRLRSLFSVQLELSRPTHPNAQGEWIALTGPRDVVEKAKEYILKSFMPRCHLELASIDAVSSQSVSSSSMAHAVHNHYDGLPPPPLTPSSSSLSCSVVSSSLLSGQPGIGGGTATAALYPRNSSFSPPYQSSLEHHHSHPHHGHHHTPTTCTSPYHLPNIDVRSREEPTPVTSTFDSEEQLRNAILQLPPEKLKNLLLDATSGGLRRQQQLQSGVATDAARAQHHNYGGHGLLSRSPDQREKKIDYFVNTLNYPREKVESVLDQLGPDAADNDILERLVKVCKPSNVHHMKAPSVGVGYNKGGHSKYPPGGSGGMSGVGGDSMAPPSQLSPPLPLPPTPVVPPLMPTDPARLRHIVIDGSNVAMRHGNGNFYSCRGIQLSVEYFRKRGHDKITVFVPEWRKEASKPETPIADQEVLHLLERESVLKYTPSRRIRGKRVACYDDRFILDLATHEEGVIVSNDQFRDLMDDKPEWREVIETRLLPFQFVNDYFMIPEDPMGKDGPTLDQLLVKNPKDLPGKQLKPSYSQPNMKICPYLEKCTFGRKCKFYHPERDQRNEAAGTPQNSTSPIGSRTPNTSRSTTPSPSPEKWLHSRYNSSNRSSGEDLRQLHSNNGSTDDLTHHQGNSGGMDIAELMQGTLRIHDGLQQPPMNHSQAYFQRPVPPNSMNLNPPGSIHSAPVFSTNSADSAASTPVGGGGDSQHLSHRYTFPMAVVPQPHHIKSSRTHILTAEHHLSTLTPQGGGATMTQPHPHEIGDPSSVMYTLPPHQHHGLSSSNPMAHHHHHQGTTASHAQQQPMPGVFMTRDGWHYPSPHELQGHGGSLMQAPTGFYPPPPNGQGGQPLPPPPGYNSRAATVATDSNHTHHPYSSNVGSSVVGNHVPSTTHTSPYHHHHHSQPVVPQPQLVQDMGGHLQQQQHRHHSMDYGHSQNVSPHRRRSYSNDIQKQTNGHLPQATSGGGGPYCDYHHQSGTCTTGAPPLGRPFHGHQSSAASVFVQSSHHAPPPPPSSLPPHSSHYNHRLPAVSERSMIENGLSAVNMDVFRKVAALFPGYEDRILSVMAANPHVSDIDELVHLIQQR